MQLIPLKEEDIKDFKSSMQEAFQYWYESVCWKSDEILSESHIDRSLNKENSYAYEMIDDDWKLLWGAIVTINENQHNELDFLFVKVWIQSKWVWQAIRKEIEKIHSDTKVWETVTPYFDKRNIHFYVNKLHFHITEYFNENHIDPNCPEDEYMGRDGWMFWFQKVMD